MTAPISRMLTVKDLAAELAVSIEHARRLIRRGDIAAVDISTSGRPNYRISRSALNQYLRDHAVAS